MNNENLRSVAEDIYQRLNLKAIEVLYDDRVEVRPGVKFNDADLIGIPYQIIVGEKNIKSNEVEIKIRKTGERLVVNIDDVVERISNLLNER
jgi:prolyl-tRNA synthetase